MNQKNYKAIAEIMSHGLTWSVNCNKLADYFEKERGQMVKIFNRKQFLKDCGVE